MKLLWTVLLIFASFIISVFLGIQFILWEPCGFDDDSYTYFFKVNRLVKKSKLYKPTLSPVYSIRIAKSTKRSVTTAKYETHFNKKDLIKNLYQNGFSAKAKYDNIIIYHKITHNDCRIEIFIHDIPMKKLYIEQLFIGYDD